MEDEQKTVETGLESSSIGTAGSDDAGKGNAGNAAKKSYEKQKKVIAPRPASEPVTYAVVRSGGKQYRVTAGLRIAVNKIDAVVGTEVNFSDVLIMGTTPGDSETKPSDTIVGCPTIAGVSVKAKIARHFRDKKVIIFKKRRTKGYQKKQGHRQDMTELLVTAIG